MAILGIDYGRRRMGIAISRSLKIANPLDTLIRKNKKKDFSKLQEIITKYKIEKIILGLPINMDSSLGEMAQEVQRFAVELEKRFNIPVVLWDERLTSSQAENFMMEMGFSIKQKINNSDKFAATIILQNYIDSLSKNKD